VSPHALRGRRRVTPNPSESGRPAEGAAGSGLTFALVRRRAGDYALPLFLAALVVVYVVLCLTKGTQLTSQVTLNGLIQGSYIALGAVGLTLVFGLLRLINLAHGDFLTFGAYMTLLMTSLDLTFWLAAAIAIAATSALGVLFELGLLRPVRARGASVTQLLLLSIGVGFIIRFVIQIIASAQQRIFSLDVITSYAFVDLRLGRVQAFVGAIGVGTVVATGLLIRWTSFGKQVRALADDPRLAEVAGIDTKRVIVGAWVLAAGLAGLAGILFAAAYGSITPTLGFSVILPMFAAAVLGGIGNPYGALIGGMVIALAQEWSTLVIEPRWKPAVGFVILIAALIAMPQGLLGRRTAL
jgi:neutral amino acid transport system permease protein